MFALELVYRVTDSLSLNFKGLLFCNFDSYTSHLKYKIFTVPARSLQKLKDKRHQRDDEKPQQLHRWFSLKSNTNEIEGGVRTAFVVPGGRAMLFVGPFIAHRAIRILRSSSVWPSSHFFMIL